MRRLGVAATARASFGPYNVPSDVDALVDVAAARAKKVFELVMDDLYRDFILEHYKRPRNFGDLEPHDLEAHDLNPLCGDEMGVHVRRGRRQDRGPALPRPRLRDLPGGRLDRLRRVRGDGRRATSRAWTASG